MIYRHPGKSDIKSLLHYLEQCFNKIRAENKIVTIMGDFNLDFLAMVVSNFFIQPTSYHQVNQHSLTIFS